MSGESLKESGCPRCDAVKEKRSQFGSFEDLARQLERELADLRISLSNEQFVAPQGWKLVPVEATDAMKEAASIYRNECHALDRAIRNSQLYAAMLAAAPTPCTQQDAEDAAATPPKSPPYPFCCHPDKCIATGRCERRVGGELHCCAD